MTEITNRVHEFVRSVGVWVKHKPKEVIDRVRPVWVVLSIAATIGAISAVFTVLVARECAGTP